MGLFDIFRKKDINEGVRLCSQTQGAILLDVRTKEEYKSGHIPGAINIPLQRISKAESLIVDKTRPIFTYCLSGARSANAKNALQQMGYTSVTNIGGIGSYSGKMEM